MSDLQANASIEKSCIPLTVVNSKFFSTICTIFSKAAVSSASLFSIFASFFCKLIILVEKTYDTNVLFQIVINFWARNFTLPVPFYMTTNTYFLADSCHLFFSLSTVWLDSCNSLLSFSFSSFNCGDNKEILDQRLYSESVYCPLRVMAEFSRFFLSVTWFLLWKINRGGLFFCRIPKLNE